MTILKRKIKRVRKKEAQFMGFYISKNLSTYFSLYCLSIGMTKSHVLKSMILDWIERNKENLPREVIIQNLAHKAFNVWNNPKGRRMNFTTFTNELKTELIFKGLGDYAEKIIEIVEDEKRKNEEC